MKFVGILTLLLLLSGCAGLQDTEKVTKEPPCPGEYQISRNYAETKSALRYILTCDGCIDKGPLIFVTPIVMVTNTAILPVTALYQMKYGNICVDSLPVDNERNNNR